MAWVYALHAWDCRSPRISEATLREGSPPDDYGVLAKILPKSWSISKTPGNLFWGLESMGSAKEEIKTAEALVEYESKHDRCTTGYAALVVMHEQCAAALRLPTPTHN